MIRKRIPVTQPFPHHERIPTRPRVQHEWLREKESNMIAMRKVWLGFFVLLALQMTGSFMVLLRYSTEQNREVHSTMFLRTMHNSESRRHLSDYRYNTGGIDDLSQLGYVNRPRQVIYVSNSSGVDESPSIVYRIPNDMITYPSKREVPLPLGSWARQEMLRNSGHYNLKDHSKYRIYDDVPECQRMYDWQDMSFPTCNNIHEVDLTDVGFRKNTQDLRVHRQTFGSFRDVFSVPDYNEEKRALKCLRLTDEHYFDEQNFDRHRKDAVAMERLTSSPHVLDIYGFCGQTGLYDFSESGSLEKALWKQEPKPTFVDRLGMATQVAQAVSNLHNFFDKGPAIAHTDIMTNQFIYSNGRYQLNDFNRAIFLYWNTTSNSGNCPFKFPDYNAWVFRAPEEYEYGLESEKIDVYSMGNVFFVLLEDDFPFHREEKEVGGHEIRKWVMQGRRPEFENQRVRNSTDPAVLSIKHAMKMCWEHDWRKRASAKEVEEYLLDALSQIESDPEAVEKSNREFGNS